MSLARLRPAPRSRSAFVKGELVTADSDQILVPSHRQMLEALPPDGALPPPPTTEQVREQPRSRPADSDEDIEEEEPEDKAVEAEASDLALRFPRRLKLSGLGFADAKRAVGAAGRLEAWQEVYGSHLLEACSERPPSGRRRPRRDTGGKDLREVAAEEVMRRVGGLSGAEFHFGGLFMRMHLGMPVWVASYMCFGHRRSPPSRDDWKLEIILLNPPDGSGSVVFEVFPSSLPMMRDARCKTPMPAGASSQARFYFEGDRDIIPSAWKNRCVLRGEAASLDLLFRSRQSTPQFSLRVPQPQAAQIELRFVKTTEEQGTAGEIYQSVTYDGPIAGFFPEVLEVVSIQGAEALTGTYRRCTSRYQDDGYRVQGVDRRAQSSRPAEHGARQGHHPLRLSECLQESNGVPIEYDSDTEISNISDEESACPSTDSQGESEGDAGAWVFYFCAERQLLLCPLIEDSFDSDDEAGERAPEKTSARWAFARYLGAPSGSSSSSSSSPPPAELTLTDVELQRALAQSLAWADIGGDRDLAGRVEVAMLCWAPVPSCSLAPAFSREDEAAREVVYPKTPLTYVQASETPQDIAELQNVRCQLLRGTLSLRCKRLQRSKRPQRPPMFNVQKELPLGQWVALDQVRFSTNRGLAELRREMYDDIFQHPASGHWDLGAYLGLPGPAYALRLREIPAATSEWMQFGGDDLAALAQEVRRKAISFAQDKNAPGRLEREPQAFSLEVSRSPGGSLDFRVCARPGVLLAALLSTDRAYPALDPGSAQMRFEWRLERKDQEERKQAPEAALQQEPMPAQEAPEAPEAPPPSRARVGPLFTLLSNHEDPQDPQPACFRDFPLRPEQLRTLHWMRAMERSEEPFVFDHESVDDFSMDTSSWKLCGRLRRAVKVRGGVLADKVGYGKTATTIGLVESTLSEGAPEPLQGPGARIPSRATLVLCPVNLQAQWVREVQKFVVGGLKVVSLQTYAQVKRVSVQDLANADLVIATYKLFHSAPYLARLRSLAVEHADACQSHSPRRRAVKSGHTGRKGRRASSARLLTDATRQPPLSWPPRNLLDSGLWSVDSRKKRALKVFEQEYAQVISKLEAANVAVACGAGAGARAKRGVEDPALSEPARPCKRRRRSKGPPAGSISAPSAAPDGPSLAEEGRKGSRRRQRVESRKEQHAQGSNAPRRAAAQSALPLELFHWKRLVLDEFHELLTGYPPAQVAVRYLKAKYRWGLSGTLPCKTSQDVVKTASFFNVHLNSSRRYTRAPATLCQRWLDHCVRRNTQGLPELRSEEAIVPVRQHPAERALYLQLTQAASDADLAGEEDAGALLALRRRGREGLVKLCSHFQLSGGQLARSATDECDAVLQRRYRELAASRHVVKKTLEEAWELSIQFRPLVGTFEAMTDPSMLLEKIASDFPRPEPSASAGSADGAQLEPAAAARKYIHACISEIRQAPHADADPTVSHLLQRLRRDGPPKAPERDAPQQAHEAYRQAWVAWNSCPASKKLKRDVEQAHDRAVRAAGEARRAVRTLEARARLVHFFEATVRTARSEDTTKCPICYDDIQLSDRAILPCAHVGCANCFEEVARRDSKCPVCREAVGLRQVMRLEVPETLGSAAPKECGRYGSKIMKLLEFLSQLQQREPEAKVILFVQWEDLKKKVAGALEEFGVQHAVLQGSIWARQRTIERFQDKPAAESGRVLLLSLLDSASGTNLTSANHVILFHPVIASSREEAVACEMQAVGRALRAGQQHPVKIWRFVVVGTMEQKMTEEHQQDLWERFRAGSASGHGEARP